MRHFIIVLLVGCLPTLAVAQPYSQAPMVIVGGKQTAAPAVVAAPAGTTSNTATTPADALANFPAQAITSVGTNSSPQKLPTTPAAAPAKAITPATNETVSKLWPSDTRKIFMPRCTSLKAQFIEPCSCVITKLMTAMTHDEFLKKSGDGTIEKDQRLIQIRRDCATAPKRKG